MAGTNQFLPFATGSGANVLTPAAYAALTALVAQGFQSGTAQSQQVNTPIRQATFVAAALGQIIANAGLNANDDGVIANFTTAFLAAIAYRGSANYSAGATQPLSDVGKLITVGSASPFTLTLPTMTGVSSTGGKLTYANTGTATVTISSPVGSGSPYLYPGTVYSVTIPAGETLELSWDGTNWGVTGGSAYIATPAQFDNGPRAASTQFVQRALGSYANAIQLTTSTTLTPAQAGNLIYGSSASAITLTLPANSSVPNGAAYMLVASGAGAVTVAMSGAGVFLGLNSGNGTSFVLPNQAPITVVNDGINWVVQSQTGQLGMNQTWQNVTGSRAGGTTYYNTTGKPILVSVYSNTASVAAVVMSMTVSGVVVSYWYGSASGNFVGCVSAVVPPGGSYSVTFTLGTLGQWNELR